MVQGFYERFEVNPDVVWQIRGGFKHCLRSSFLSAPSVARLFAEQPVPAIQHDSLEAAQDKLIREPPLVSESVLGY